MCTKSSYDCLTDCINNLKNYTKHLCSYYFITCSKYKVILILINYNNYIGIYVFFYNFAAFNESIAAIESSGSQLLCSLNDGEYNLKEGLRAIMDYIAEPKLTTRNCRCSRKVVYSTIKYEGHIPFYNYAPDTHYEIVFMLT